MAKCALAGTILGAMCDLSGLDQGPLSYRLHTLQYISLLLSRRFQLAFIVRPRLICDRRIPRP